MRKTLRTYKTTKFQPDNFWITLWRTPFRKQLMFCVRFVRHLHSLTPLLLARRGSNLHRLVKARPNYSASYLRHTWLRIGTCRPGSFALSITIEPSPKLAVYSMFRQISLSS